MHERQRATVAASECKVVCSKNKKASPCSYAYGSLMIQVIKRVTIQKQSKKYTYLLYSFTV